MSRIRIVGGAWRGRQIQAPEGAGTTRPTTSRTREAMASMVSSAFGLDLSEVRALDAFAGSGALGLEFLSRGAAWCTFCDKDGRAASLVRRNAQDLGAARGSWRVIRADAFKLAGHGAIAGAPFSLVLLDPPYATPARDVAALVEDLSRQGSLAARSLILYERDAASPKLAAAGARHLSGRSHGTTAFDLYELRQES